MGILKRLFGQPRPGRAGVVISAAHRTTGTFGAPVYNASDDLCGWWIPNESDATSANLRAFAAVCQQEGLLTESQALNITLHAVDGAFSTVHCTAPGVGGRVLILTD